MLQAVRDDRKTTAMTSVIHNFFREITFGVEKVIIGFPLADEMMQHINFNLISCKYSARKSQNKMLKNLYIVNGKW